jgi:arabinogalactan oligomer / maltooligosaccharide transport system permease protein
MKEPRWVKVGSYAVLTVFTAFALLPVFWVFISSFKVESEVFSTRIDLIGPSGITFANYQALLSRGDFQQWFINSVMVATVVTVLGVFLSATAAYALSRYRFYGRGLSLYSFLLAQMFPGIILLVPLFQMFTSAGLIDSLWSLVIAYSTIAIPFSTLMLKSYFDTIPTDLEEAGMVDGLNIFGAFWRIVLPLSVPGIAVTAFYSFITAWNEFMLASAFLVSRDKLTLPVGLSTFIDPFNQPWHLLTAAAVLISIPVMVFFFLAQRYLISGLQTGGVKG